ncbi:acyltransferase family protein [Sphingomonas solaris]|uniref:acyltransferase family protein n=1 Tax=Alterirhizorhabdus solaris TaxID=2529389 RepID=UPI001396A9DE|nr:acyltransferase [Sphingomonas solaris]
MTAARPNPNIVYSIQLLRGLAAMLVLVRHTAKFAYPGHAFPVGQAGVDIFFAISGIVIYLTSRKLSWHVFVRRRLARIVPLYWLATTLALLAVLAAGGTGVTHGTATVLNTVGSFLFIPTFDGDGRPFPLIVAGWTLNFEMYFYAICAMVLATPLRSHFTRFVSAIIVAGVMLGCVLFCGNGDQPGWAPLYLLLPITLEFVGGMLLAHAWTRGVRTPLWLNLSLVVAAIGWLALAPSSEPYTPFRPIGWGIPALAIVWAAFASEERIPFARFRFGLLLGDSSYALYLIHPIALAAWVVVLRKLPVKLPSSLAAVLAIVGCVVAGILVHLIVEKWLVRIASRLLGLRRPPSPACMESTETAR